MSTVSLHSVSPDCPAILGKPTEFRLAGLEQPSEVHFFVRHDGILYPAPLVRSSASSLTFEPEAPGTYAICARWRSAGGEAGWAEAAFTIEGPPSTGAPERIDMHDGLSAWTPSPWEAFLAEQHEAGALDALGRFIAPGATVYDIGANIGLFATRFAKWVGASGRVYCLEPNPLCVYFLKSNLHGSGATNFEILPVGITDSPRPLEFKVHYGSSVLGKTSDSTFRVKPGHRIVVEGTSLDALIQSLDLRPPDVIKLDVEGAEDVAVGGMIRTLVRHRPTLMIELHGAAAAHATLAQLAPIGYRYQVIADGRLFPSCTELAAWMPDDCVQVMALR